MLLLEEGLVVRTHLFSLRNHLLKLLLVVSPTSLRRRTLALEVLASLAKLPHLARARRTLHVSNYRGADCLLDTCL